MHGGGKGMPSIQPNSEWAQTLSLTHVQLIKVNYKNNASTNRKS